MQDPRVMLVQPAKQVSMDIREKLVPVATEEKLDPKDPSELLDQLVQPENQEPQEQWETVARSESEDKPVCQESPVHPEM